MTPKSQGTIAKSCRNIPSLEIRPANSVFDLRRGRRRYRFTDGKGNRRTRRYPFGQMNNPRTVLHAPVVTEKATNLRDRNTYTFKVDRRANKIQIRKRGRIDF